MRLRWRHGWARAALVDVDVAGSVAEPRAPPTLQVGLVPQVVERQVGLAPHVLEREDRAVVAVVLRDRVAWVAGAVEAVAGRAERVELAAAAADAGRVVRGAVAVRVGAVDAGL